MELVIARRFRGPAGSGNGGYTCGVVAAALGDGPAEVTLRLPPPLDRPLRVEPRGGGIAVLDGDAVVAEARPAEVDVDPPPAPVVRGRGRRGAPARRPGEPVPGVLRVRPRPRAGRRPAHLRGAARRARRGDVDAAGGAVPPGVRVGGARLPGRVRLGRDRPRRTRCSAGWRRGSTSCRARASRASSSAGRSARTAASCSRGRRCTARTAGCSASRVRRGSSRRRSAGRLPDGRAVARRAVGERRGPVPSASIA